MDEQPQNENANPETETTTTNEAPAPKTNARKGAVREAKPAKDHVLGEGADADFDPVAHGQQTALENHNAEQE